MYVMEINPYGKELHTLVKNFNSKQIELLQFEEEKDKYTLHLSINSYPIKLTTNFEIYCYFESDLIATDSLNLEFLNSTKKSPNFIFSKLIEYIKNTNDSMKKETFVTEDYFHIYQKIISNSKIPINFNILEKESKTYRESKNIIDISKFPKELLFNPNQIYHLLVNEIKKINENKNYNHYIEPINNNPYQLSLKLKLKNQILIKIKEKFNYDFIEMKVTIEPKMYPFYPPKFEILKPAVKLPLVFSLMNLKILKLENWNPTISLEWLIINFASELEKIIHQYVKLEESKFMELDFLLVKLSSMTKETSSVEEELIKIEAPKFSNKGTDTIEDKYWKSGVGYGHESRTSWDIGAYVKEQEILNTELSELLHTIHSLIDKDSIFEIYDTVLPTFIINRISGLSLLELEKNKHLYDKILVILDKISTYSDKDTNQELINKISNAFTNISEEIASLFQSSPETQNDETYIKIHCISDWYKSNSKVEKGKEEIVISNDVKTEYETIMKKLQFDNYEISNYHKFKDCVNNKMDSKSTMRILSEISTFKKSLPLNWESTIWTRVSKKSLHVFSFFISGPKDTPYENGIFEFHANFPTGFPETVPQVLLHTTGKNTVRFNPNLYNCGKVCLSLLGTWSGQEGEKWNPKTSTFLQVLVSIQSLIFVENPYFNEPGYEKNMHNSSGKQASNDYSENIQIETIRWAINDMIKNPPVTMETVIKQHFTLKKEEIINTTEKWLSKAKRVNDMTAVRKEMLELLDNL